jgi:hypothetical protein
MEVEGFLASSAVLDISIYIPIRKLSARLRSRLIYTLHLSALICTPRPVHLPNAVSPSD